SGCPSLGLWMPATPPRFPRPLGDWSETNLRSVGQPYGRGFRELQLLSALIFRAWRPCALDLKSGGTMMGNAAVNAHLADLQGVTTSRPRLSVESLQTSTKRILFVTPEFADLIKDGGLGDVSASLPRALHAFHDIRVLMPGYPQVLNSGHEVRVIATLPGHAALPPCRIGRMDLPDGLTLYVVICPELYEREGTPYGDDRGRDWDDNHIRFARLGLAAAQIAAGELNWAPELVHANDWQSALAPAYMHWPGVRTPCVFTVPNLAYPGLCELACFKALGLPDVVAQTDAMEY